MRGRSPALADTLLHRRASLHFFAVGLFVVGGIAAILEEIVEGCDDADAHHVVVLGDVPEPAVLAGGLQHHGCAFVATRVAVGAFPVPPDPSFVQNGTPDPEAQSILNQTGLSARVHDNPGPYFTNRAVLVPDRDACSTILVPQDIGHPYALMSGHALLARVV